MFFVAARKDTKVELEKGNRNLDFSNETIRKAFRSALCTNYGIKDSNLSFLYTDDASASVVRVMSGDEYTLNWSAITGEITGLDFSVEDAKRWIKIYTTDPEILADGVDSTTLTVEVWKADKSGIATNVTGSADVPILTPTGPRKVRVSVTNGVASKQFKTTLAGEWVFPAKTRFKNLRVLESCTVEAIQPFATL